MKGFTLLEILIGTVLTALILTAVYGAYTSNLETIQTARENALLHQTARMVFDMMRKDLQCALAGETLGVVGEDREMEGKPADRLQVITAASHATTVEVATGLYRVVYEIVRDEKGERFALVRTQVGMVGAEVETAQETYELTGMISGLDMSFRDSEGRAFERWDPREGGGKTGVLPSLVQVKMVLKGPSGQERTFLTAARPELAGSPP